MRLRSLLIPVLLSATLPAAAKPTPRSIEVHRLGFESSQPLMEEEATTEYGRDGYVFWLEIMGTTDAPQPAIRLGTLEIPCRDFGGVWMCHLSDPDLLGLALGKPVELATAEGWSPMALRLESSQVRGEPMDAAGWAQWRERRLVRSPARRADRPGWMRWEILLAFAVMGIVYLILAIVPNYNTRRKDYYLQREDLTSRMKVDKPERKD